jgi:hypothetical protein
LVLDRRDPEDCFFGFPDVERAFAEFDSEPDADAVGFMLEDGAAFCILSGAGAGSRCCVACEGTAAARKRTKATTAAK